MTDEALIRSATSAITAYVPAGAEASAAQQAAASALQTITTGLTFSQKGHFTGWDAGQAALGGAIGLAGQLATAAAAGQVTKPGFGASNAAIENYNFTAGVVGGMAGGVTTHFLGATSAYFGNGDYSGYNNPGLSGLGVMANALGSGLGRSMQAREMLAAQPVSTPEGPAPIDPVAASNMVGGAAEWFRHLNPFGQGGFVRNALGSAFASAGWTVLWKNYFHTPTRPPPRNIHDVNRP